jgi:copper chaperone NosL
MRRGALAIVAAMALAALVMGMALITGCAPRVDGPPNVRWGQAACAQCRMLISDARFAAARVPDGDAEVFDSVECLVQRLREAPEGRVWVRDYLGDGWLDPHEAVFVRSAELTTPMGGGLVAVADVSAAQRVAEQVHGHILRYDELLTSSNDATRSPS